MLHSQDPGAHGVLDSQKIDRLIRQQQKQLFSESPNITVTKRVVKPATISSVNPKHIRVSLPCQQQEQAVTPNLDAPLLKNKSNQHLGQQFYSI